MNDRDLLYSLLGELPRRDRPIGIEVKSREEREQYQVENLILDLNGLELVPAWFVKPVGSDGPVPVVLYNHAHGGNYHLGKDELIHGRDALQDPPYAEVLAVAGYAGLCIGTWCFGERHGRTESSVFKEMLWKGRVLWGMMVYDHLRALDYLVSRDDVDANRIATLGISMGSTMAWWLAALDTRIKVCVDLCCLTDFEELIEADGLDGHGLYYFVPSLLKHFSTSQINALVAPRPHLSLAGDLDPLTPTIGLEKIDRGMRRVYAEAGAEDAWVLKRYDVGHLETAEMRQEVMRFLNCWL